MFVRDLKELLKEIPDDLKVIHWEGEWGYTFVEQARIQSDIQTYISSDSDEIVPEAFVIF